MDIWKHSDKLQVHSRYRDHGGHYWDIDELLASDRPRVAMTLRVKDLWQRHSATVCWSQECGSLEWFLSEQRRRLKKSIELDWQTIIDNINYKDTREDHVLRVAGMIKALMEGWNPDPLVYGLDGELWDGHHRLCALHFTGSDSHPIIDFTVSANSNESGRNKANDSDHGP